MESGSFGFSISGDVESGVAKRRPSSAADYAEIVIQRKGQPALNGEMWVADGLLTVTSSDGRQKTAQVGNSRPAGLARSCYWNWKRSICMLGH
jgi:hypothetical protein